MGTSTWLSDLGLENPSTDEYLNRPDLRQIATFFSGILFAASLYYFLHSPTLASILSCLMPERTRRSTPSIGAPRGALSNTSTTMSNRLDPLALVFILDLVYITTAATQFGSLLSFSSATGAVPCTFLIAWGALGSETVRLIGLLKLSIHLQERGASKWEKFVTWGALTVLAIIMFLTTAVNTGVLRPIPHLDSMSLCYVRHFLAGTVATKGLNLVIELFVLGRLISLLFPRISGIDSKVHMTRDAQLHRALSLVVLDGATIYPSLFLTSSILADFVPFSVTSILVLVAFNHNILPKQSLISILNANSPPLPQSIRIPTPNFSPFLNMESSKSSSKEQSIVEFALDRDSRESTRAFDQEKGIPHPFAAESLTVANHPSQHWRSPNRAVVSQIEGSGSPKDSVRGGVVTTANRTRLYPAESPVLLKAGATGVRLLRLPRESSSGQSFLPALRTGSNGSKEPPGSQEPLHKSPTNEARMGRRILQRQAEVADQMLATPRSFDPGHRVLPSQSSIVSQDKTIPLTPPAPPRTQRVLRQDSHPMRILSEETNNPGETRPSTTESAVVFGSDILLRSQDDIMRVRGEIVEGSVGTGGASAGHGTRQSESGSFEEHGHRNSPLNLQVASPSQQSFGAHTAESLRIADAPRPHTGQSQNRTDVDTLSVVHEGLQSPARTRDSLASRKARNAHKRPTFGESLFDRFQRGFTSSDASGSASHAGESMSPSTPAHRDVREDLLHPPRPVPRFRLRSSTVGGSKDDPGQRRASSQKRPAT